MFSAGVLSEPVDVHRVHELIGDRVSRSIADQAVAAAARAECSLPGLHRGVDRVDPRHDVTWGEHQPTIEAPANVTGSQFASVVMTVPMSIDNVCRVRLAHWRFRRCLAARGGAEDGVGESYNAHRLCRVGTVLRGECVCCALGSLALEEQPAAV